MSAPPRVLFVGAFPDPTRAIFGGIVTSCRTLLQSSLPRRADLVLLDSTQISNPPPSLPIRLLLAIRRLWQYVRLFEARRPDVVLLFTAVGASVAEKGAMAWYARLRGVPALMFPRGGAVIDACEASEFTRWWVKRAFAGARRVLCQGPRWQRFAVDVLGFERDDAPIIGNWTATPALARIGANRGARPDGTVRLLFVGWLDREKGVDELLDAFCALGPGVTLALAGEGNLSESARAFVAANGLDGRVKFLGWRQEPELLEAYAAADVFVLPSWAEGLPNAMIEAMAAGLACVVSAVGNVPEAVDPERDALLVPPRDRAALTAALRRVTDDASLRARLGAAAHALAIARFGVERAADELMSTIAQVRAAPHGS